MGDYIDSWRPRTHRWGDADYQRTFMQAGLPPPSYAVVQGMKARDIDPEDAVSAIVLYQAGDRAESWPPVAFGLGLNPTFSMPTAYQDSLGDPLYMGTDDQEASQKMGRDIPRGWSVAPAIFYDPRWVTWMWRLAVVAMVLYLVAKAL